MMMPGKTVVFKSGNTERFSNFAFLIHPLEQFIFNFIIAIRKTEKQFIHTHLLQKRIDGFYFIFLFFKSQCIEILMAFSMISNRKTCVFQRYNLFCGEIRLVFL